jgi:hypothetical protein
MEKMILVFLILPMSGGNKFELSVLFQKNPVKLNLLLFFSSNRVKSQIKIIH